MKDATFYEAELGTQLMYKPERYEHSISVSHVACEMAKIYGADAEKARVAGILHDWEKALSLQQILEKCASKNVFLEGADQKNIAPLLHGPLAAVTLHERYPELDDDVLESIAYHTTAAFEMSDLDKIIYVADAIEPLRGSYERVVHLRSLVGEVPLQSIYVECMADSLAYVLQKRKYLYPVSLEIYNAAIVSLC